MGATVEAAVAVDSVVTEVTKVVAAEEVADGETRVTNRTTTAAMREATGTTTKEVETGIRVVEIGIKEVKRLNASVIVASVKSGSIVW